MGWWVPEETGKEEKAPCSMISPSRPSWDGLIPSYLHSYLPQCIPVLTPSYPAWTPMYVHQWNTPLSSPKSPSHFFIRMKLKKCLCVSGTEYNVITVKHRDPASYSSQYPVSSCVQASWWSCTEVSQLSSALCRCVVVSPRGFQGTAVD